MQALHVRRLLARVLIATPRRSIASDGPPQRATTPTYISWHTSKPPPLNAMPDETAPKQCAPASGARYEALLKERDVLQHELTMARLQAEISSAHASKELALEKVKNDIELAIMRNSAMWRYGIGASIVVTAPFVCAMWTYIPPC